MMQVDARGLSCPEPVVMTRKAVLQKQAEILVLVDNPCAVENVTRFAQHAGYTVECSAEGAETHLTLYQK